MVTRSTRAASATPRSEQEFAVAVPAENRGGDEPQDREAEPGDEGGEAVADRPLNRLVRDDPLAHPCRPGFELRLHQRQEGAVRFKEAHGARKHELERDEAHIGGKKIDRLRNLRRGEAPRVRRLEADDAPLRRDPRMQLPAAYVDRVDL